MYHSWHKIIITILKTSSSILSLMEEVRIWPSSKDLLSLFTFIMVVSAFILPLTFLCLFLFRFLGFKPGSRFIFLMSLGLTLDSLSSAVPQDANAFIGCKKKIKIHRNPPTTAAKKRNPTTQSLYINIFILPPSFENNHYFKILGSASGVWICGTTRWGHHFSCNVVYNKLCVLAKS